MTVTIENPTSLRNPLVIGTGLSALWLLLGLVSAGTTYHLAPLLVTAVPASLYALEPDHPTMPRLLSLIGAGVVAALAVIAVLAAAGKLEGPSLLPFGGAVAESLAAVGVGVAVALVVGLFRSQARQ